MIPRDRPFVLLDDTTGPDARCLLYREPVEIVRANHSEDVAPALDRLRHAVRAGAHAVGYLAYEAGQALEPRLGPADGLALQPYLWFGLFERAEVLASRDVARLLPDPAGAWVAPPRPLVSRRQHAAMVATAQERIAAGDIYQANVTFPCEVTVAGDPRAAYARIRAQAGTPWGALVFTGERWLLSFSPELFFTLEAGRLTARPMKGTAARDGDDRTAIEQLRADPKQRAENLMIVDLLRNDLARVAVPGSVAVPELFAVETYPTVHQMTSTVTARIADGLDAIDVLAAAFPCGSVTGAPKIRAMEVIDEVETFARNAYTGSIGRIASGASAAFNVAIRTLELREGDPVAILGLGSGIVADSRPGDEWLECLAKGSFVTRCMTPFDLIETMRFDAIDGIQELEFHLERLKESALALGFAFDRHALRNELQAATFRLRDNRKLRVVVAPSGKVAIEAAPLPPPPATPVTVAIAPLPVAPDDFRLRHKTTDRAFHEGARRPGCYETVYVDPEGFLTEGTFTNLFVPRDGLLLTPPRGRGVMAGILRRRLLEDGKAIEAELTRADLAAPFFIGNSVRGLIPAVAAGDGPEL